VLADLQSREIRTQLVGRPSLQPGQAYLTLTGSEGNGSVVWATDGQLYALLTPHRIEGEVTGTLPALAATITGKTTISCARPTPNAPQPGGLEVDDKFESPECQPFAGLVED